MRKKKSHLAVVHDVSLTTFNMRYIRNIVLLNAKQTEGVFTVPEEVSWAAPCIQAEAACNMTKYIYLFYKPRLNVHERNINIIKYCHMYLGRKRVPIVRCHDFGETFPVHSAYLLLILHWHWLHGRKQS